MSLDSVVSLLNKKFGKGAVVLAKDAVGLRVQKFSTGCVALDIALCGGWAHGRMIELVGEFSTGKTTLALYAAISYCKAVSDGYVVFVDFEQTFDPSWFKLLGGDLNRLSVVQPSSGEEGCDLAVEALRHAREQNDHVLVIIDSIAAIIPMHEIKENMDNKSPAMQARLLNKLMRKLTVELRKDLTTEDPSNTVMFLNQTRLKLGIFFGDPTTAPGGKGKDFFVSQQIMLRRKKAVSEKVTVGGVEKKIVHALEIGFTIKKNKCQGPQDAVGSFLLYLRDKDGHKARSFGNEEAVINESIALGLITRQKNTFIMGGRKIVGRSALDASLVKNRELYSNLYKQILELSLKAYLPLDTRVFAKKKKKKRHGFKIKKK